MGPIPDKENLPELFKQSCICVKTRGIQDGVILKFPTFYLKVYDDGKKNSYIIQGYRYNSSNPMFVDNVPVSKIREYASRF